MRHHPKSVRRRSQRQVKGICLAALVLFAWQVSYRALADATINFSGTLVNAPNCTVNGNNAVDVDFGDEVITRQVDGLNYKKPVTYVLSCSSIASNGMKVAIRGTAAPFGTGLINTTKSGLAIQLWHNSEKLSNGTPLTFTYPDTPLLYATPVAQDNAALTAGTFSGTASLVLSYQ